MALKIKGKHCIECLRWFPLWMYKTDSRKFTLPTAFKKVRKCRLCVYKESGRGSVVRWNGKDFEIVTLTFKQRIIEFLNK